MLGPGKSYTESFHKKPAASQINNQNAPISQQEIPVAPPNVYKNIPKEVNPEDLKKESIQIGQVHVKPKEETAPKQLHSAVPER